MAVAVFTNDIARGMAREAELPAIPTALETIFRAHTVANRTDHTTAPAARITNIAIPGYSAAPTHGTGNSAPRAAAIAADLTITLTARTRQFAKPVTVGTKKLPPPLAMHTKLGVGTHPITLLAFPLLICLGIR